MAPPQSNLLLLPVELLKYVLLYLPNHDIKNVRLACTQLRSNAQLRFPRVFLSPNPRNIAVFKAIAKHDNFRHQVVEIIYDDARLCESVPAGVYNLPQEDEPALKGVPVWYQQMYKDILDRLQHYKRYDTERPDHLYVDKQLAARFDIKKSYKHYKSLLTQQQKVINAGSDIKALQYGFKRFPHLQRITLTPAAHGGPFFPLYETPMIRDLPDGFLYPPPRGWPMKNERYTDRPIVQPWVGEDVKKQWRGFRLIALALVEYFRESQNQEVIISELVIDTAQLMTGLSCRMFDDPVRNDEYAQLCTILDQPGFSRLDLALNVLGQCDENWDSFRRGNLRAALAKAVDLQHISLSTNVDQDTSEEDNFVPLRTIFPIETWTHLRHFGLSRLFVMQVDLFDFISALPLTIQSIELSFLLFCSGGGNYRDLLADIRQRLQWHVRPIIERPKLIIRAYQRAGHGHPVVDIDKEVEDFLYCDGLNPFADQGVDTTGLHPLQGFGIQRNLFNPALDRPNMALSELRELGILKPLLF